MSSGKRLVCAFALAVGLTVGGVVALDGEHAKPRPCNRAHPCTTTSTGTTTTTTTTPPPASEATALGVYEGAANLDGVLSFASWLGRTPTQALDFIPRAVNGVPSWAKVDNPTFWTSAWESFDGRMAYSLPLTISGTPLSSVANGCCDSHFRSFASNLVAHGQSDAVVRLGWEFNGSWYPWAASGNVEAFKDAFQRAASVLQSVAPNLSIAWCRTRGGFDLADPSIAYPGDGAVDVISLDSYDNKEIADPSARWAAERADMDRMAAFAAQHPDKPFAVDEWGLLTGDSTVFIDGMADWFAAHDVDYQMVFDFSKWDLDNFPDAKARYRARFGP